MIKQINKWSNSTTLRKMVYVVVGILAIVASIMSFTKGLYGLSFALLVGGILSILNYVALRKSSPKKYHWYEVEYCYNKDNRMLFSWNVQIGVDRQSEILNYRDIKKRIAPLHIYFRKNSNARKCLCNGFFSFHTLCYLGYFAKEKQEKVN